MSNISHLKEKEYMMLRAEIDDNLKERDSLANFSYTVVFAIITAAIAAKTEWILLGVIPFLFPVSLKFTDCGNSIAYLAAYMKVYLEKDCGIQWESNHYAYYKRFPRFGWRKFFYHCARCDFSFLIFICSALFWLLRGLNFYVAGRLWLGILILVVQIVAIVGEAIIIIHYNSFSKMKEKFIINWTNLKEQPFPESELMMLKSNENNNPQKHNSDK